MMICGQALAQGYIEKLGYYPGFPTHATQWDIVWDQTFLQSIDQCQSSPDTKSTQLES